MDSLSPVLGGEGWGEGRPAALPGTIRAARRKRRPRPPLTLALSPAYRGEGKARRAAVDQVALAANSACSLSLRAPPVVSGAVEDLPAPPAGWASSRLALRFSVRRTALPTRWRR